MTYQCEVVLLRCDEMYSRSGRIYPKEVVQKAIDDFNELHDGKMYIESREGDLFSRDVDMRKVIGVVNDLIIEDNKVKGTLKVLDGIEATKLQDISDIILCGEGDVNHETNTVSNYKIHKSVIGEKNPDDGHDWNVPAYEENENGDLVSTEE